LHQAALGSVPRSINDPVTTNDVNIAGFEYVSSPRDAKVKRFVYAASSSTVTLKRYQKWRDVIETPSPYAITKYVNELYAWIYLVEPV
jgi:UDP-N-acetylglucosamine 4-epimerase